MPSISEERVDSVPQFNGEFPLSRVDPLGIFKGCYFMPFMSLVILTLCAGLDIYCGITCEVNLFTGLFAPLLLLFALISPGGAICMILTYVPVICGYLLGLMSHPAARKSEFLTFLLSVLVGVILLSHQFGFFVWGFTVLNLIVYSVYRIHVDRRLKRGEEFYIKEPHDYDVKLREEGWIK
jgi:hypothetical protein